MNAVLDRMPPACVQAAFTAIANKRGGIVFHRDLAAVTDAIEKQTGEVEKSRVAGFVAHHPGEDSVEVHLDGGSDTDTKNPEKAEGVYAHELGHAVDAGRQYSDDPKWQSAWKREIFNGKTLLSRYARLSATEGFAELHRALCEKGVEATARQFPKCCAFMKAKGLL